MRTDYPAKENAMTSIDGVLMSIEAIDLSKGCVTQGHPDALISALRRSGLELAKRDDEIEEAAAFRSQIFSEVDAVSIDSRPDFTDFQSRILVRREQGRIIFTVNVLIYPFLQDVRKLYYYAPVDNKVALRRSLRPLCGSSLIELFRLAGHPSASMRASETLARTARDVPRIAAALAAETGHAISATAHMLVLTGIPAYYRFILGAETLVDAFETGYHYPLDKRAFHALIFRLR